MPRSPSVSVARRKGATAAVVSALDQAGGFSWVGRPNVVAVGLPSTSGAPHTPAPGRQEVPCPFWSPATVIATSFGSLQGISLSRSPHNSSHGPQTTRQSSAKRARCAPRNDVAPRLWPAKLRPLVWNPRPPMRNPPKWPPSRIPPKCMPPAECILAAGEYTSAASKHERRAYSTQSAHFCTSSPPPHGITGTEDVEFFGEPSIRRSE
jgi:hypothetical protein